MKKILLILSLALIFTACSKRNPDTGSASSPTVSVPPFPASSKTFDYDFTAMTFDEASEVLFEVLIAPDKYADKTARIQGLFNSQIHEEKRYYSAIIWDEDACCPTGLDFLPPENLSYPEDFPPDDANILVYGKWIYKPEGDGDELEFIAESISVLSDGEWKKL